MNKLILIYIMAFIMTNSFNKSFGQATSVSAFNIPAAATDFLGWSTAKDLDFMTGNTQFMKLDGTTNVGFFSLSNTWPFTPQVQLHQHWSGNTNIYHQFTNGTTLATASDGFLAGIAGSGIAEFRQQEAQPIIFFTNDATSIKERMRITYGNGYNGVAVADVTKVNISYGPGAASPIGTGVAILNLGESVPAGGGQRNWMDVGTFGCIETDNAYFGLKYSGTVAQPHDHYDAVVGWGDNVTSPDGADNLRFIVSTATTAGGGQASLFDGLEVSRYSPIGLCGIGNFSAAGGSGIQPSRRLEIYDNSLLNPPNNLGAPQLRLTVSPNANPTLGIWTDFQTMATGHLFINPCSSRVERFVGINILL